ncbi:MAG: PDZ domain-containing protein [Chloroflexi bacterium]|nr:PDZ domain-containing protein [Chloroflexota bacterium]
MKTKGFVILLVATLLLGGGLGGAFAGGVALGKSQGSGATPRTLPAVQSTSGSGQQSQGQLSQLRQQFQSGQVTQEQLQQFQGQLGQGGSQGFSGRGGLAGTVEEIEGNTVIINTAQGPLQATVGGETTIQLFGKGSLQDLKARLRGGGTGTDLTPGTGGDVITAADGRSVLSVEALASYFNTLRVGDTVTLTVIRNGQTLPVSVVLGEWPDA